MQSENPALQVATWQVLAMHADVALGRLHASPQAPQLARLDVVSVSQPLAAMPSQLPECGRHATTVHTPPVQPLTRVLAPLQAVPQAPQLAGSMAVLAQYCEVPAPQVASGDAQVAPQWPPEHTCPVGHNVPQAPQLALSVMVLTQVAAQTVSPVLQDRWHVPPAQRLPAVHAVPHMPQLCSSVWRSAQELPHAVWPVEQVSWHVLPTHTVPIGHALPHAPQLSRSVVRFAQNTAAPPSPATPPSVELVHVARPAAQVTPHWPLEHICPARHVVPHVPQFVLSVWVLTQVPPHAVPFPGQVSWQVPATQSMDIPQAWPHDPQFEVSVATLTQKLPHRLVGEAQTIGASIPASTLTMAEPLQLTKTASAPNQSKACLGATECLWNIDTSSEMAGPRPSLVRPARGIPDGKRTTLELTSGGLQPCSVVAGALGLARRCLRGHGTPRIRHAGHGQAAQGCACRVAGGERAEAVEPLAATREMGRREG